MNNLAKKPIMVPLIKPLPPKSSPCTLENNGEDLKLLAVIYGALDPPKNEGGIGNNGSIRSILSSNDGNGSDGDAGIND
ncbi:594_t:CDS:2 [Entrophospora sp. SA101]|nr:14415_t:CDS:2 [Entrophospora sp. SA101]CAJ0884749.1 594_t:CDS:2 [Entrophospora sp. SA101]